VQKRAALAFDAAADEVFSPLAPGEQRQLADMLRKVVIAADAKLAAS
jgi:hypothetical protein